MPIQEALRARLIAHIESKGFAVEDSTPSELNQQWSLECPEGHRYCPTISNLKLCCYQNKAPVCSTCKYNTRLAAFCERSGVTLSENNTLITCNECELSYRYFGDFYQIFRCCCKRGSRRTEHALYKELHKLFPGDLSKEIAFVGSHKADIVIFYEDKRFFVEVDEVAHFSLTRKEQDKAITKTFLEHRGDNDFLIRVEDGFIKNNPKGIADAIADSIRDFEDFKVICTRYGGRYRYEHLEIPEDDLIMIVYTP